MSRYAGNSDECPGCGLLYEEFRTGLTYQDVFIMLWTGSDDPNDWRYKRRHTVLGYWHMIKLEMWRMHIHECTWLDDVPF